MPISDRRLAANRANALKSTGPRTLNGQTISRRNALKHGLAGKGTVLPPELEAAVETKTRAYHQTFQPADPYEADLVRRIATAQVRGDFATKLEFSRQRERSQSAVAAWDAHRADLVRSLTEPLRAARVDRLRTFTEGCDWLADAWDSLDIALDSAGCWTLDQARLALHLMAEHDEPRADSPTADPELIEFWSYALALIDPAAPDLPRALAQFFGDRPARLPDLDDALARMRATIADSRAGLAALADEHWDSRDCADRLSAHTSALVDDTPEGRRLDSYRRSVDRDFHRSVSELRRHRAPSKTSPRPAPPPARNEPTAPPPSEPPMTIPSPLAPIISEQISPQSTSPVPLPPPPPLIPA